MPTTAQGIADFGSGYEKIIQSYIQDNIPEQIKLFKVMKTNDNVTKMNNAFYVSLRSGRSGGVQTLANDKSKLNTGGAPLSQGSITPTYQAAVFDISDPVIKSSSSSLQALTSELEFQTKSVVKDFLKNINRQMFSDGVGIVGMVSESGGSAGTNLLQIQYPDANASTNDTRATAYYGTTGGGINGDIMPAKYFAPGQIIGIGSAGANVGTIINSGTAVQQGTQYGTLALTAALPSAAAGSMTVSILDGDADASGTSEIQGFRSALSEGTQNYMGLSRNTYTWQPQYAGTASLQSISIPSMEQIYQSALEYAMPGDRYVWFCNKSLYNRIGDLLTALRKTVNKTELVSGWSGYSFEAGEGNVPIYRDYDCPDGELMLINVDTWTVCEMAPMGFLQDGNLLRRVDYITYQKVFSWYMNMACRAPAANGRMVQQTR